MNHPSERKRMANGLVLAHADYLILNAHEVPPLKIYDAFEAFDNKQIRSVGDYFKEYALNTIVAPLSQDTTVLPER